MFRLSAYLKREDVKLKDFAAIDFETANHHSSSVCSVGIVIVRDGKIVEKIYRLIRPYPNFYISRFTEIHGLTKIDTDEADQFDKVWTEIKDKLGGLPLVAHNARFDEGCLKAAHKAFDMEYPDYKFYCTLSASRRKLSGKVLNHRLPTVARYCGYDLERHHEALADAEATSSVCLYIQKKFGVEAMFGYDE